MPRRKCEFDSRRVLLLEAAVGRRQSAGENDNALLPASCPQHLPPALCGWCPCGTGGRLLSAKTQVRFLPPQLKKSKNLSHRKRSLFTEVIRPDEEPVLKTGGGFEAACGFESHGFRSRNKNRSTKLTSEIDRKHVWSRGPAAHDSRLTSEQRRFDSFRDYCLQNV